MRPETAVGERAFEVRRAARTWRRAGTIDDAALASIGTLYADDRVRAGFFFRILFLLFATFAIWSAYGLALVGGGDADDSYGVLAIVFGAGAIALTELQTGRLRRDRGGTEEATAFSAVLFLLIGAAWLVFDAGDQSMRSGLTLFLCAGAIILAAAAWRWAHLAAAMGAAVCGFWILARLPFGRWLWAVAGAAAIAPLLRASVSARLAPSHRRACAGVLLVALLALYASVSIWSFDRWIVERVGDRVATWSLFNAAGEPAVIPGAAWAARRFAAAALTALVPLTVLAAGIRMRRRVLLDGGALLAALSLATVRAYWHLADTWMVLAGAGAALIGLALLLRRRLDAAPGKERGGLTAEPLFPNRLHGDAVKVAAAVAAFAPAARPLPGEEPHAQGRGGLSGGGGAGGEV